MTSNDVRRSSFVAALALCAAGCGDASSTPDAAVTDAPSDSGADAAAPVFLLTVQGTLRAAPGDGGTAGDAGFDTEYARSAHNGVVGGFMSVAMSAGDLTHHVALGQTDGSQFLAFDTWNSLAGLNATLADPGFQSAFSGLFSGPPTISVWQPAAGFSTYIQPATASARIVLMVRGTLRAPGEMARATHNGIVTNSMSAALMAGDVSHTVWLNPTDPAQFLAVDVWTSSAGVMGFLSDPQVAGALGSLFTSAPTLSLYTMPAGWTNYGTSPAWGTL